MIIFSGMPKATVTHRNPKRGYAYVRNLAAAEVAIVQAVLDLGTWLILQRDFALETGFFVIKFGLTGKLILEYQQICR